MTEQIPDPIGDVLKRMPYGFYALGSRFEDDNNLMVCNWVTQASYEPRLIAIGLQKTAYSYGLIEKGKVFTLNLFLESDADAIKPFTKSRAKNPDKMTNAKFAPGPQTGAPVLDEAAAYLECKLVSKLETGGDHDIILGEVINAVVRKAGEVKDTLSLPYIGWNYAG
jgi:flavin reductase (DIM6/NTAB) family NADH-FMN oxidoreductase RutF